MKVTLLAHTPNPERLVATAARLCYSADDVATIMDEMCDHDAEKQIKLLQSIGHESPIEHVCFTFAIEGVSRSLLAQITRHRLASFSVRSQRYVKIGDADYNIPESILLDLESRELYNRTIISAYKAYEEITRNLMLKYLNQGMDEKSAEKKAIEDARFVLPNAACTSMIVTMNARELLHFFRLRTCNRAQWEIREVADKMLAECYRVAPTIFKDAGCGCCSGSCPEGRMSCGKPRKAEIDVIKEGAINNG
jgi:thymidylate synthase (FAD)